MPLYAGQILGESTPETVTAQGLVRDLGFQFVLPCRDHSPLEVTR